jgi:hypothetical protein
MKSPVPAGRWAFSHLPLSQRAGFYFISEVQFGQRTALSGMVEKQ